MIAGAVLTSQVVVQRLTDYIWLGNSRVDDIDNVLHIARILNSLKISIQGLERYYTELKPQPIQENSHHPRFFPSITSYRLNNRTFNFIYSSPLETDQMCVTFLATLDLEEQQQQKVVVKFVRHYGEEAHKILARLNLAPELIYFGPIADDNVSYGTLQMVVMEYIHGQTLVQDDNARQLLQDVKKALKKGIDELHNNDFVYGDLRGPNVMIVEAAGDEDVGDRVRLIDFDWARRVGEIRYPPHLAPCICKVAGVSEYDLIQKNHDIKMLDAL